MAYKDVTPPAGGKISIKAGKLTVPENPIIPFIRGDGTGPDIWASSVRVFDAAVEKAYGGKRKIAWFEVFAGETSKNKFDNWLPDDTVEAFKEYLVGIKGPLTTPVGDEIRDLARLSCHLHDARWNSKLGDCGQLRLRGLTHPLPEGVDFPTEAPIVLRKIGTFSMLGH